MVRVNVWRARGGRLHTPAFSANAIASAPTESGKLSQGSIQIIFAPCGRHSNRLEKPKKLISARALLFRHSVTRRDCRSEKISVFPLLKNSSGNANSFRSPKSYVFSVRSPRSLCQRCKRCSLVSNTIEYSENGPSSANDSCPPQEKGKTALDGLYVSYPITRVSPCNE